MLTRTTLLLIIIMLFGCPSAHNRMDNAYIPCDPNDGHISVYNALKLVSCISLKPASPDLIRTMHCPLIWSIYLESQED